MTPGPGERLVVGRVGRAHGLRGEVAVTFTSNRPERSAPGAVCFAGDRELVIVTARPHQGKVLIHFEGVDSRTAAEALQRRELTAERLSDDVELAEGELWIHELVGSRVVEQQTADPGTGDDGTRVVVIDPPEGLFDL
jgi:16S rRNA processing protein RimM